MTVRLAGVDELLNSISQDDDDVELALLELWDMLKEDRGDALRLSDIIPHVLLRVGGVQECYDFIKCSWFDNSFGFDGTIASIDRPLGELAEGIFESSDSSRVETLARDLQEQYLHLYERANASNPYFWEGLVTEELPSAPGPYVSGSLDEARLVLYHCRRAWDASEDALVMVEAYETQNDGYPDISGKMTWHCS
ncbi:hypothetical protein HG530_007881 [Fusarium avenaceum]|nr:hypothetical protein HG530_007881 [Fusarium avenaceum]